MDWDKLLRPKTTGELERDGVLFHELINAGYDLPDLHEAGTVIDQVLMERSK